VPTNRLLALNEESEESEESFVSSRALFSPFGYFLNGPTNDMEKHAQLAY
jgi:hypothetical protein